MPSGKIPSSSPWRSTPAAVSSAEADLSPPERSIGIIPSAGNRCFVFHESMYSALPMKLMLRDMDNMRNAESRNEMWFGHRIAGPSSGSRSWPAVPMCHSLRATGRADATQPLLRFAGPGG